MSKDYAQIANDVVSGVGLVRQGAPDTAKAFGSLLTAATATKALDTKTKELMALAIGIAVHCEGCVAYHTKMAHQHGAAREEVVETVALAVYIGGRTGDRIRRRCPEGLLSIQPHLGAGKAGIDRTWFLPLIGRQGKTYSRVIGCHLVTDRTAP